VSSSSLSYVINHEKLELKIRLLNLQELFIHEEIIPEFLEKLVQIISMDGYIKHPVIVDSDSLVVLDGMHRIAALKKLGCIRIPACMVDYQSPSITVECWYRVLKENVSTDHVLQLVNQIGFTLERVHTIDVNALGVPPIFAALQTINESFLLLSNFQNVMEAYQDVKRLEEALKRSSLKICHETERDAFLKLKEGMVKAVLLTPKLSKKAIVETALSGQVFAYKATRHIIPARPLRVNVPLTLLQDETKTLEEANQELIHSLQEKKLKYMPAGSIIEGRRYEEDVYLFEG
jgi:hypothetical protein